MRPALKLVAVAILATPLIGCAVYQPASLSPAANGTALDARTLDDPRLRRFIAVEIGSAADPVPPWRLSTLAFAALYYDPDIAIADANLAHARAGAITAAVAPNPSLSFANVLGVGAVAGAVPAGAAAVTVGPAVNFLIETFGKREDRTAQALRLADAARWDLAAAAWQARSRVRTALLDLWTAKTRIALTRREQELQDELVTLLEQRLAAGEAAEVDVMLVRLPRTQTTLALRNLEQDETAARAQLAAAVGVPLKALEGAPLSTTNFDRPPLIPKAPGVGRFRREALTGRADVRAALQQYEAAQDALKLQIASQYPNVTLSPGYNYDFGVDKFILGLGTDQLPVFNQNQGPIAEALAARIQAAARFSAVQSGVIAAIDAAVSSYEAVTRALVTADKLLSEDQRRAHDIESQFEAGQIGRVAWVGAEIGVAATALSRFDAVVRQRQAIGALEDALQRPLFDPGRWPTAPMTAQVVAQARISHE